jgi:hypothetical protein
VVLADKAHPEAKASPAVADFFQTAWVVVALAKRAAAALRFLAVQAVSRKSYRHLRFPLHN